MLKFFTWQLFFVEESDFIVPTEDMGSVKSAFKSLLSSDRVISGIFRPVRVTFGTFIGFIKNPLNVVLPESVTERKKMCEMVSGVT